MLESYFTRVNIACRNVDRIQTQIALRYVAGSWTFWKILESVHYKSEHYNE
jgi:hypothetical protein